MRLIVFDLDGTLIDSRRDLADATNALIAELGGGPLTVDEVTSYVGEGVAVLVRRALSAAGLDPQTPGALDRFLTHYDQHLIAYTRPYPGIPDALTALRAQGFCLAVLTNKPSRQTLQILERLQLRDGLVDVIGGDTSAGRKPDPAGLLRIVQQAEAVPAATILVGDSAIDLQTARNAGTKICLARYGFGYRFADEAFRGDEMFIDEPSQLVEVIANAQLPTSNSPSTRFETAE